MISGNVLTSLIAVGCRRPPNLRAALVAALTLMLGHSVPAQDPAAASPYDFRIPATEPERAALDAVKGKIPGFIIFESNRDGAWHLYRMNADGTEARKLTNTPKADTGEPTYACISPDGKTIAWEHRYTASDAEIWVMDADGGNQRPLITPAGDKKTRGSRPTWLPDGRLKFTRSGSQTKQTVWIYDFKKAPPSVSLLDKIQGKEPVLPKNHLTWNEELLAEFKKPKLKWQQKRILLHEMTPDLKNFVAWSRYPGRGVWWMTLDGTKQEKIHGGCSPRVMPDGKNFTWVIKAGRFGIGSFTEPVQTQVLFAGPYPGAFNHGYFPYLTPDYQWLLFSACPHDQHDQDTSNYQLFIAKMGPNLQPEGPPTRLSFNTNTDRYPVMWYEGMKSPAAAPVIQGDAHVKFGGPDDLDPEEPEGDDEAADEDAAPAAQ